MDPALKSVYDYTGKIKQFIEQDYGDLNEVYVKHGSEKRKYDEEENKKVDGNIDGDISEPTRGLETGLESEDGGNADSFLSYRKETRNTDRQTKSDIVDANDNSDTARREDGKLSSEDESQTEYDQNTDKDLHPKTADSAHTDLEDSANNARLQDKESTVNEVHHTNSIVLYNETSVAADEDAIPLETLNDARSLTDNVKPLVSFSEDSGNRERDISNEDDSSVTSVRRELESSDAKEKQRINNDSAFCEVSNRFGQYQDKNEVLQSAEMKSVCTENDVELRQKLRTESEDEKRKTFPSESFLDGCKPHVVQTRKPSRIRRSLPKVENMDPDTVCGLGSFRPQWLQPWATARTYLILFSIVGVLQGSYYTYLTSILTTLEKRYAFENKISGTVMMVDEITPLFLGVLVGYFGGKSHRPRIVALGMFLSAVCCFLSALPYFMYGTAKHLMSSAVTNGTNPEYCAIDHPRIEHCQENDRPPTMTAVAFLLIGSFLKGFGSLAYFAVGISYMDDSVKKTNTPIYLAVCIAFRLLGPILGFLMSSAFLRLYENPFEDPGFDVEDPRWVGAWWMGFVLQGLLLCIFNLPILLFPRRLPRQRQRAPSNTANFYHESMSERIAGMFKAVRRLATNPVYILYSAGAIYSVLGGFGLFTMMPKYMEHQFRLSASDASMLSGPPNIAAVQIFTIIGGIIIWKWKPDAKKLIMSVVLTSSIEVVSYILLMIPTCPELDMAGTTTLSDQLVLDNICNADCNCTLEVFTPVCGPDGVSTYFSPCHAGCTVFNSSNPDTFFNCSCIVDADGNFTFASSVSRGYCPDQQCWTQAVLYTGITFTTTAITSLPRVVYSLILFRSVEPADKSVALGAFETLLCGLAFLPYPLIYTALADHACLIWESSCGDSGNCWLYDTAALKYLLHGISGGFALLSAVFMLGVYAYADRVRDIYQEDDEYVVTKANGLDGPDEKHSGDSETFVNKTANAVTEL